VRDHADKIRIAVMCPPDIYGCGKGPGKKTSAYVPFFLDEISKLGGKVFYYGEGTNTRSWVHIDDVMRVFLKVVEAAAAGNDDYFNGNGYFFAGTQEHAHLDVAKVVGKILHAKGVVADPEPQPVSLEQLDSMLAYPGFESIKLARYLFASNSRNRAERAKALFGYKAESPDLLETLEPDISDILAQKK
jgi:nucleoside-diphosphate-sugar epimerase